MTALRFPGRTRVFAFFLLLTTTLLSACGTVRIPMTTNSTGDAKPVDGLIGVGAFVSADGYLLASRSFLGTCEYVTANDQVFKKVADSARHDMTLLKGANPGKARIRMRTRDLVAPSETVTVYDAPEPSAELQVTSQAGEIKASMLHALLVTAKQTPRHPGGPIVDQQGLVVGTVSQSITGGAYINGIPAADIVDFLRRNGVTAGTEDTPGGAAARAVVPLQCWRSGAAGASG